MSASVTVSVGICSYRVSDSEKFDEPRGEITAYLPRLVEVRLSEKGSCGTPLAFGRVLKPPKRCENPL